MLRKIVERIVFVFVFFSLLWKLEHWGKARR